MSTRSTLKKIAAVAAGAGVATIAGLVTVRAIKRKGPTVIRVEPAPESWQLRVSRDEQATRVFGTKKEAVSAARQLAHQRAPSELVIHRADGSVQARHAYDE